MDTTIYSQEAIDKYILTTVCLDDKTLYKYFTEGKVKEFRARLIRKTDQKTLLKVALTICTDLWRPRIYKIIKRMQTNMKPYGNLIVSGGEAFNLYLPKAHRVITGDIDTKFIPGISASDPKAFGKLQVVRLAMWNALGKAAVYGNSKCAADLNKKLKMNKIAQMLGLTIDVNNPFRMRYTLLPKLKQKSSVRKPKEGDVLMDVEIFALDLNVKCFNVDKNKVVAQKLGGILDAPIIKRDEFSSDVYKDFIKRKEVSVASKRFLLDDLELLVKYGIRTGPKLVKDKKRLDLFIRHVFNVNINKTNPSFDYLMKMAKNKLPKQPKTPRRTIKQFPFDDWKKFNPQVHKTLIAPASLTQLGFILYPMLKKVKAVKRMPVNLRFSPKRARWATIKNNQQRGNILGIRPNRNKNNQFTLAEIKKVRSKVLSILEKEEVPLPSLLYGYVPARNNWMPTGLIDKASIIGLLGQLK